MTWPGLSQSHRAGRSVESKGWTESPLSPPSQNEFIFSSRIDNLFSSYAALEGLIRSSQSSAPSDGRVSMIALFDNEEVGSVSAYGAESNFIESVFERVSVALRGEGESEAEAYQRTMASSFLLSCASYALYCSCATLS